MQQASPLILWLRQDLRISDNPALYFAAKQKRPIIVLYIYSPNQTVWPLGGASKWWLHHSLLTIKSTLQQRYGLTLVLAKGEPHAVLDKLIKQTKANAIYWNECFEPHFLARDLHIETLLTREKISVHKYNASHLFSPWEYQNNAGQPFKVFTPFWKKLQQRTIREIYPTPQSLITYKIETKCQLEDFDLLSHPAWYTKLEKYWHPGERAAKDKLKRFVLKAAQDYQCNRDRPDLEGTSMLSPHLHFGEISPVQIWHATQNSVFLSEVAWREFSYHLLHYYPDLPTRAFKPHFNFFSWHPSPSLLKKWQQGKTGYPIVDAGMRQLWETGWMHNRVRMIVASFLVKHLLQPWQQGEAWFWDTLVDADLANNAASWQWVAGSGADASPYFRIFNPVLQGQKFDPKGDYVKKWIPELQMLDIKYLHQPWQAPEEYLNKAKIKLGKTYPLPIIEHSFARQRALGNYKKMKNSR